MTPASAGAKYDAAGRSATLFASRGSQQGLRGEVRRHRECRIGSFLQSQTEVSVLLVGEGVVRRRARGDLQTVQAGPGALWLCPKGVSVDFLESTADELEIAHFFLPEGAFWGEDGEPFEEGELDYLGGFKDPLIEHICRALLQALKEDAPSRRLLVDALGHSLAVRLRQGYHRRGHAATCSAIPKGGLDRRRLARVLAYIDANLGEDLGLGDIAAIAHLSPFHFSRAFKASTGQPPHHYLRTRRLERACDLLASGEGSLSDIALSINFSSQANFAKAFRRATGVAPGQYRKEVGRRRDGQPEVLFPRSMNG